jgi:DNA-directed RNA polymerase subunit RPC12/RpoP
MASGKSCARCKKDIRDWMGSEKSQYGDVVICEVCGVQEMMEKTGQGPRGKLQFPVKPYDGPRYWEVASG